METTRRQLLSLALYLVCAGVVQTSLSCKRRDPATRRAAAELRARFQDHASIVIVGLEAALALPDGISTGELAELVAPERGPDALRLEIQEQYRIGETVDVAGWPLALTEARIFALLALTDPDG